MALSPVGFGARMTSSLTCTFPTFPNPEEADCSFLSPPGASRETTVLVGNSFIGDPGGTTISDFVPLSVPIVEPTGILTLVDFISVTADAAGWLSLPFESVALVG